MFRVPPRHYKTGRMSLEKLPPAPPCPQTHLPWCECPGWEGKGPGPLMWVHSDVGDHPAPETYLHYPRLKHKPVALSSRGQKPGLHIPKGQLKPRSKCTQTPASPSADSGPPEKGLPGRLLQHRAGRAGPEQQPWVTGSMLCDPGTHRVSHCALRTPDSSQEPEPV